MHLTDKKVVQAVVKATSQSNGKGQILTPWGSETTERISMQLGIYNRVAGMPTHANPCGAATTWVVWANTWKNTCCGFLGIPFLSVKCNFDRLYNHFGFCLCVCPPIGCRTITSAVLYRFLPNFARRSEMWLFRTLLFMEQTGSSLPLLEMCKIQFWQFRDCGGHIFSRIVIKTWIEI